ncbi:MAG: hypothetical protein AAF736_13290 [Pseudomonadota bacterium]
MAQIDRQRAAMALVMTMMTSVAGAQTGPFEIVPSQTSQVLEAKPEDTNDRRQERGPDEGTWAASLNALSGPSTAGLQSPYAIVTHQSHIGPSRICGQGTGASAFAYAQFSQRTTGQSSASTSLSVTFDVAEPTRVSALIRSRSISNAIGSSPGSGSLTGPTGALLQITGVEDFRIGEFTLEPGRYTFGSSVNGGATCVANSCDVRNTGNWQASLRVLPPDGIPGSSEAVPRLPDEITDSNDEGEPFVNDLGGLRLESQTQTWEFLDLASDSWISLLHPGQSRLSAIGDALITAVTLPQSGFTGAANVTVGDVIIRANPGETITFADFTAELGADALSDNGAIGVAAFDLTLSPDRSCGDAAELALRLSFSRGTSDAAAALIYGNLWFFRDGFE